MRGDRFDLPLRIVVDDPVPGVALALQHGSGEGAQVLAPVTGDPIAFEFEVAVEGLLPDGRPRLLGPFVQGPPAERFVYLCVGQMAGGAGSPWRGRVKVPLKGITVAMIEALTGSERLEARIPGRDRKGGPALASVQILPPGWGIASR